MLVLALVVGLLYALPNLYGEDPAVQITGARGGAASESTLVQIRTVLEQQHIASKSIALENGAILARFSNSDVQLRAREALMNALGENYVVALNLAPATPPG
ncbi:Protein translocase subunit SecD [Sodalis praecaptivus]